MDTKANAKFQNDLRGALEVLAKLHIGSAEMAIDMLVMRHMATQYAKRLQAQSRPLAGHVVAAQALCLTVKLLDGTLRDPGFETSFSRRHIYQAAHLLGQAKAYAAAADANRRHGGMRRTTGLVTPFLEPLLATCPDAGGTELARRLQAKTGLKVSPVYVNRLRRARRTTS